MTLHRGPRTSHPQDAVAKRRHAELDAQFDALVSGCCHGTFKWTDVGKARDSGLPMKMALCDECGAWCGPQPQVESKD